MVRWVAPTPRHLSTCLENRSGSAGIQLTRPSMPMEPGSRAAAREAGRDPGSIGMEGRVSWMPADPDRFSRQVERWRGVGATHLTIDTMSAGQHTDDDHLGAPIGR